ncbi:glyoxalase/bleomycin resistance/dioxygenase family protein [Streptomyces alkaliphilus]|uniref:Glyoxalase/bleomycin resistance/dioxygenase family protein n=1 Tax=Streptomyces alkaliphilus TaxID=1472722 RepID=A0A7W3TAV1_9ACTN|nr:VOC family protein [Streptomyces alkaliphilus]MBB0243434.1 glyoxalase/bleomycin resistance/dioxygenase family protein [Streptomyces alkaliphilus]
MGTTWKVVFDADDANRLADFWAGALGYEVEDVSPLIENLLAAGHITGDELVEHDGRRTWRDYAGIRHPEDPVDPRSGIGLGRRLLFQHVPEAKTVKNRLHIDVQEAQGDPERLAALVGRLEALGARVLREVDQGPAGRWVIMADPEGNEFCAS